MRRHKITRAQSFYFQGRILFWMKELNQQDWTAYFESRELGNCIAQVEYHFENRGVTFVLNTSIKAKPTRLFLDDTAIHEVGHLFVAHLEYLAERRYIQEEDLNAAREEAVCILTRVISKYYNRKK